MLSEGCLKNTVNNFVVYQKAKYTALTIKNGSGWYKIDPLTMAVDEVNQRKTMNIPYL